MPDLIRYPMVEHSYILELKYLKQDATDAEAEQQWQEAVAQIRQYAQGRTVRRLVQHTSLHSIVVQIKGYTCLRTEEVPVL